MLVLAVMRVFLAFPPVSPQFHMPYLSIPALGAYLKQEEPSWRVRMADLNVELARKALEPEARAEFRQALAHRAADGGAPHARRTASNLLGRLDRIEAFLGRRRGGWRDMDRGASELVRWFNGNELKHAEMWLREVLLGAVDVEHLSMAEAIAWADAYPEGTLTRYLREDVVPRVVEFQPDLLGFSWVDHGQVVPTLILLRLLREAGLTCRTVVGGPYVSLIWERLPASPILEQIDHFVARQGEEPLLRLARSVAAGEGRREAGALLEPRGADVRRLPVPDFGDYELSSYLSNELRLCLLGSWGCYWGECSFCNARRLEGVSYSTRTASQIVDDMLTLQARHHPDAIRLSDNAIGFPMLVRIAKALVERGAGVAWATNSRLDGDWTAEGVDLIARSGCEQLMFGLESASEPVRRLINKGTDLDRVHRVLALLARTPIKVHFYMILGYPSETRADWLETLRFFEDVSRRYPKLSFTAKVATFGLQVQSSIYYEPARHHISDVVPPAATGWSTMCRYRVADGQSDLMRDPDAIYPEMRVRLDRIWQLHNSRHRSLARRLVNRAHATALRWRMGVWHDLNRASPWVARDAK